MMIQQPPTQQILARFFAKIKISTTLFYKNVPCWEWTAGKLSCGYGSFSMPKKYRSTILAHRLAYQWFVGPTPPNLTCDHLCRNRGCVNPVHIELVTHRTNILRGIGTGAANAQKTSCKRGHAFDEDNTIYTKGNHRVCKTCKHLRINKLPRLPKTDPRFVTYQQRRRRALNKRMEKRRAEGRIGNRYKTHCPQGHPYAGENLAYKAGNRRVCKECSRIYMRNKRAMKKQIKAFT